MGLLNRINPFVQVMYDDKLNEKRRNLDAALTFVFLVVVIIYMVFSVETWLNPNVYTSKCLTAGVGLDVVKIKQLCYTPEKPVDSALTAFTCRGSFGGEVWGIVSRLAEQEKIIPTTDALKFCARVITDENAPLEPFGLASSAEGNIGILEYDTAKKYTLHGDETNAEYYKITNYKEVASTFTCCGWSKMSASSRILGYLAAVGGFAGFLKALLASIPPHHHADTPEQKHRQVAPTDKDIDGGED